MKERKESKTVYKPDFKNVFSKPILNGDGKHQHQKPNAKKETAPKTILVEGLSVIYTNADSIRNKMDEFQNLVKNNKPHLIAITEFYPKSYKYDLIEAELKLPDYNLIRNRQEINSRGCAIYLHKDLEMSEVEIHSPHKDAIWCEIKLVQNDKLLIGCLYRSPGMTDQGHRDFIKMMDTTIRESEPSHILIVGDFNLPEINWSTCTTTSNNMENKNNTFMECIRDHYLFQHVTIPTRGRGNQNPNILDLILTNEENMVSDLEHLSPLGHSDHAILRFKFNCYLTKSPTIATKYNYNIGNYEAMNKEMNEVKWEEELEKLETIDSKWQFIKENITSSIHRHIPKRNPPRFRKNKTCMFSENILAKIRKKHRAWQRYIETKDGQKYKDYCQIRNKVKSLTRRAKIEQEKNISRNAKDNPKKFWQYVKSKTKTKDNIPDLDIPGEDEGNSKTTTNDFEKAETLLNYFSSVFTIEGEGEVPNFDPVTEEVLEDLEIGEELVRKKLENLKTNKSPGPDAIHPKVLYELSKSIASPLTILFRFSLSSNSLPQDWRDAHVSAIFKKGNKKKSSNYRPVSLTCISCKILESIIKDHVIKHMQKNKLFSKSQFGFMKGRSTSYQLLITLEKWTEILDQGGKIDTIYFDFMKAFDTVPHNRLLNKLPAYGINNEITNWVRSFLTNRRQKVVVNGHHSNWSEVTSGIPQGSILGPLLFILYINDLPSEITSNVMLFADDTKIFHEIKSIDDQELLQSDINNMFEWSNKWLLRFHPDKCKVMRIGAKEEDAYKYSLDDKILSYTEEEKDLGVTIDNKLKFETHIANKVNTANKVMGIIRRSFTHLDKTTFIRLFKALVRPHLEYANPVWHPNLKKSKTLIENVQRRATKQLQCCKNMDYEQRLRYLDLPCAAYRKLRGDMIEVYKIVNSKYDEEIEPPISVRNEEIRRTRGNKFKLTKKPFKKKIRSDFFSLRVSNPWNELPDKVVEAPSTKSFERRLDKFWTKFNIKYDFDRCILFEKQMTSGTGTIHLADDRREEDLETPAE